MSKDNTCGPAFPQPFYDEKGHVIDGFAGMTLRDYFAAKAMQGLLSNPKLAEEIKKHGGSFSGWIEETAWSWADGMLEKRQ